VSVGQSDRDQRRCASTGDARAAVGIEQAEGRVPPIAKPEIDPLAAFAVKANRLSAVTTSQQVAACCVETEPETSESAPASDTPYDDAAPFGAAPPASETIS